MIYFLMKGTEIISEGTIEQISKETGRSKQSLYMTRKHTNKKEFKQHNREYYSLIEEDKLSEYLDKEELDQQQWAVYKGENYLTSGTINEIANFLKVKLTTAKFYAYPSYLKRNNCGKNKIQLIKI